MEKRLQAQDDAMMALSPALFHLDAATLGYAIGRLLRHTSLGSACALRNATVAFLADAGISLEAMSEQDRTVLFRSVGRGYGTGPAPSSTRKEVSHGAHDH